MTSALSSTILLTSLVAMVLLGRSMRRHLPDDHLSADSKDAVKLAMGLVATMTALLLGLLVSSAKGTYDTQRTEVIQMAAKVAFLDRVLTAYGPEAAGAAPSFAMPSPMRSTACGRTRRARGPSWPPTRRRATASMPPSRDSPRATTRSAA